MSTLAIESLRSSAFTAPSRLRVPARSSVTVGATIDPAEHEAERIAAELMRMPAGRTLRRCACGGQAGADGECAACRARRLERQAAGLAPPAAPPPIVDRVLASSGRQLDAASRSYFEPRLGIDLGGVRIHDDGPAAESARAVDAHAYTVGNHIAFAGTTEPGPSELLAHELVHVAQQHGAKNDQAAAGLVAAAAGRAVAGAARGAAAACPAADQAEKMTACIEPVVIADDDGKNPTAAPSFEQVQSIWKKCCIDYSVNATKTVKKSAYKTLDESPDANPTDEEKALFRDAGASACIQVFVPADLAQGGKTGKDISGGGGTYDGGTAHPKIVLVDGAVPEVVAHEVGHASGHLTHDAADTVMKPTGAHDKPNATAVSADVCTRARTGAVLKKGAAKDCCMTPK